jgi:hypothetical protein
VNREEFSQEIQNVFYECWKITEAKNADYATEANPFENFKAVEKFGITTAEQGILVRLSDKWTRLINLMEKAPAVKDEKIEDTINDMINYLAILEIYLINKRNNTFPWEG